jgi:hypothetical protein
MAYSIFLKYLRSLEEFRKNPPKSPCANFQSLGIFKNLIFIQKRIFFGFWPIRPSPAPQAAGSPLGQLGPSRVDVFSERRILFDLAQSGRDAFSLSHHRHVGPACQLHPLPHAGRPLPFLLVVSRHLAPPSFTLGCRLSHYSPHHHLPPLIPLLTSPLSSMALKPLTPPLLPPGHPSPALPRPL